MVKDSRAGVAAIDNVVATAANRSSGRAWHGGYCLLDNAGAQEYSTDLSQMNAPWSLGYNSNG